MNSIYTQTKISVVIATYNEDPQLLIDLFYSLQKQTVQPTEIIIVDNSSDDHLVPIIQKHCPQGLLLKQSENLDFDRSYNLGMSKASSEYILILNADLVLKPNAIEYLLKTIQTDARIAAVGPKLYRLTTSLEKSTERAIIDSLEIIGNRSRRFINRGEGTIDTGEYTETREVFGLSGTAILFRTTALHDVAKYGGGRMDEYFDEDFVAYKEDIDLAYRLQHRGWKIMLEPRAIMYHKRTAQETKKGTIQGVFKDREQKSVRIRGNSYRNHLWILIKNEPLSNLLVHLPWIGYYECAKFLFLLFFERSTLAILPSFFKKLPRMLKKRKIILSSSQISHQKFLR